MPLLLVLTACSTYGPRKGRRASALSTRALTATAAEKEGGEVDTLATAEAKATQKSLEIQATQLPERGEDAQIVEATLAAPMVAELPQYGLDKSSGHPARTIHSRWKSAATSNDLRQRSYGGHRGRFCTGCRPDLILNMARPAADHVPLRR